MAGVDKGDQLRQYYRFRMNFMKNYKYMFFLLDTAITTAFILYSKFSFTRKKLKQKEFCLSLAQQLTGQYCGRMRIGQPRLSTTPHPQSLHHHPTHFPRKRSQQKCVYCSGYCNPPSRHESRWCCKDCEGNRSLCLTGNVGDDNCWRLWHTAQ